MQVVAQRCVAGPLPPCWRPGIPHVEEAAQHPGADTRLRLLTLPTDSPQQPHVQADLAPACRPASHVQRASHKGPLCTEGRRLTTVLS